MPRRVFYSFHYDADNWRASQVRNIGVVEGNQPATDNDWESVKRGGAPAIQRWIDNQLSGRTCTVVLIGAATAGRHWINYEISKSWSDGKGLVGIHIHRLKDQLGDQARKGANPFTSFKMNNDGSSLADHVKVHDPPYLASTDVYAHISDNLGAWIEEAIRSRAAHR